MRESVCVGGESVCGRECVGERESCGGERV